MMLIISTTSYSPLIHLKTNLPTFTSNNVNNLNIDNNGCYASGRGYYCIFSSNHPIIRKRVLRTSSSNQGVVETSLTSVDSASTVVRKFYEGINGRDLASVENLIAENCVYEDLIFPQPFVGRKAILDFFNKFIDSISTDLQFVIDNISEDDVSGVGVTWHMEWKGKPFPFSKGCSFYRLEVLNGQRQILYGRDSVEPAIKPGEAALIRLDNCRQQAAIATIVNIKAILDFFNKFIDSISTDLQFVIDDISEDDVSRVGVTWHMVRGGTVWSLQSSLERQTWYSLESYRVPPVAIRAVT